MKIEKITICNLTSIEGEQVIDFTQEPLRSASLFAITGDTGAGKSTILDAVCLALYNRAPRFDDMEQVKKEDLERQTGTAPAIQAKDVRGMFRRGCTEAYCKVVFSVPSGARYEAGWSMRQKRTGNYDRVVRTLQQLAPRKEAVPPGEIEQRIADVIGLDYAQFTRTVMLAQNSFANFLRAKRSEKSALLEKLTGTAVYGQISVKIHELAKEAEKRKEAIENVIAGIRHDYLCPEDQAALSEERTLVAAARKVVEEQQAMVAGQLKWFDDFEAATRHVADMTAAYVEANRNYMAMRAEEQRLERYDSVVAVQPLYGKIAVREKDIDSYKNSEKEVEEKIQAGREGLKAAAAVREAAAGRLLAAQNRQKLRKPVINRGHVLSGEINEAREQLKSVERQLKEAQTVLEDREKGVRTKETTLTATQKKLGELLQHKQALSVHRLMFDKFDLVKDKLSALTKETEHLRAVNRDYEELQRGMKRLKDSMAEIEKGRRAKEDQLATDKAELERHRESNAGRDGTLLQQRSSESRKRLAELLHAKTLWARISTGYEEMAEKRAELDRLEARRAQTQKDIDAKGREVDVLVETHKRLNVAFTLSQSKDIVQLRKQLKEGTACPVCGATHHPYHTETERELGELLNNLEKEFNEASAELAAKSKELDDLKAQLAQYEGRLTAERKNLLTSEKNQNDAVEEWKDYAGLDASLAGCSPMVARDARRLLIDQLIDGTKKAADEAEAELKDFNFHQEHINSLNEKISRMTAEMNEERNSLEDSRTQLKVDEAESRKLEDEKKLSDKALGTYYADLDVMVTLSGWYTLWLKNPDTVRLRLTTLHTDWLETTKNVEEQTREEQLQQESLKSETKRRDEAHHQFTQCQDNYSSKQEALNGKCAELARDFGESTPEEEEKALQDEIAVAQEAEVSARADYDGQEGNLKALQGGLENLRQQRQQAQKECKQWMDELSMWLQRFNATHPPMQLSELQSLFSGQFDWKTMRDRLDALKKELSLSVSRMDTANKALTALQGQPGKPSGEDEATRQALTAQAEELKATAKEKDERLTEINLRLLAHANSVKQVEAHRSKLEKAIADAEEWNKLDSLLGSSDGRKFRELAQSYTFDFLVEHANEQLRQFSPRYELRNIPGTLTLEIIDRDMFDEHRYVNSLSGGETFVVSLALALGLASLSGNNLAIGSLFIDEGFGNLDHDSLDLVMSALSNLENAQGRKVGVISHTDQIRAQISPQIRLVKHPGSGRSTIKIG